MLFEKGKFDNVPDGFIHYTTIQINYRSGTVFRSFYAKDFGLDDIAKLDSVRAIAKKVNTQALPIWA